MQYQITRFLLSKWTRRILYIIGGIVLGSLGVLFLIPIYDPLSILKTGLAPLVILASVVLASRQFVYTVEWNKKDAGNKAIHMVKKNINNYIDTINPHFDLRQMMRNGVQTEVTSIHNAMGVFIECGEKKIQIRPPPS